MKNLIFKGINKTNGNIEDHKEVCRLLFNHACNVVSTIKLYDIYFLDENGVWVLIEKFGK